MKTRVYAAAGFLLLIALTAIILLRQPSSDTTVVVHAPADEPQATIAEQQTDRVWVSVPRKAHEPELEIEVLPDKLVLPKQDNEALIEAALDRQKKKLTYRFATRMELHKKASEIGTWKRDNGMAVWQLQLESPNATSLNLGLDQFHMPPGGKFVFTGNKGRDTYVFTSAHNEEHGELWTPIVRGSTAMLEITLPEQLVPQLRFRIEAINHGFRGIKKGNKIGGDTSGSCNVDVVCSEGDVSFGDMIDFYRDQIGSVGAYTMGGVDTCTGALINNTNNDRKPLFLTANHCGVTSGNAASMVVYWNFQNSTCRTPGSAASGSVGNGDLTVFNTGSIFRSTFATSDFCLVELDDPVNASNTTAYFAGWDRTNTAPSMAIGIHHPAVAEKRISFEYDQTTRTSYSSSASDSSLGTHIRVIDWDEGTTEGGSSGSPLFNSVGRIVGQLHGGGAACGNNSSDWYGRVYRSWTGGGSNASRLSNWLDPTSSGVNFIDGIGLDENLSIADASISEGDSGTQVLSLTVTLSEASTDTISCQAAVTGGDATAGVDFVNPGAQTLTFNPGVTSATYDITINGDTDPEEHESIIVTLSSPNNATITDGEATVLILNDDYITPNITGPTSDSGTQGVSYTAQITALNTPTSYGLSGAPAGMTVDTLSGEISWPSPTVGNFSITLEASNSAGTDTETLNLTIVQSDIVTAFEIPNNASFALNGTFNWALQTLEHVDGVDGLAAIGAGNSSSAHLDLTITGPDQLLFHRKVSTEAGYDFFEVSLDGSILDSASGVEDWTPVLIDIPAGEHTVRISYVKDGSVNENADTVWIDRMTLASSSPPDFNSPHNISVPSGVPVAIDVDPRFNVTNISGVTMPAGATFQDGYVSGTFTTPRNFTVEATNGFGTTTRQFTITPFALDNNLADAVGAPTIPFIPGSSNWYRQTSVTRTGTYAIRSGVITHNQDSTLSTEVYGPGTLSFYWQASSEANYDFGLVYLNGNLEGNITGSTGWQQVTLNLEPGLNDITWRYLKDISDSAGFDAVFVDDITLGGFAGWVAAAGLSPYSAPPNSGTDGDQNSSLMEYAIGGSPTLAEAVFGLTMSGDPGSMSLTTPANGSATDVSLNIQKSTTMQQGSWTNMPAVTTSPTLEAQDTSGDSKAFYRLHLDVP